VSGPNLELEERLRQLAPAFKDGIEPPATLHLTVMSATAAPRLPRRSSMLRELSLAAALVAFVALLAFGFSRLHLLTPAPVRPNPTPKAITPNVIPWASAPMVLPSASAQLASPADAATWIGHTVTAIDPLLLPTAIGDDYTAEFVADPHSFVVDYSNSVRHATVELAALGVMPNQGATARPTIRTFRGVAATYQVEGATPTAVRTLYWTENSPSHAPYALTTAGLNETEFWQVADSLRPLTATAGVRPCVAADLRAGAGHGNGASGQIFNNVLLSNHSASPCQLEGTPQVLLRTSAGRTLSLPQASVLPPWLNAPPGPALMAPNSPDPQSDKGSQVGWGQASLVYSMWDCPANRSFSSVLIVLPNQRGTLALTADGAGYSWGGQCEGAVVQRMAVGPFVATEPPPIWVDKSPLSITVKLPDHVRAGESLHYLVVLTNASGAPFHFYGDCPSYAEDGSRSGAKIVATYQLNCASVGWLAPDQSVTFAMALDIPATTPPGLGNLRWSLHSAYGNAEAVGAVTVTTP
jgi:hypothetical protein